MGSAPAGRHSGCRARRPGRGWGAIVVGEYERAFYENQYGLMAPLFEQYGVQLWMPETGGRVDYAGEHDERAMTMLGLSSKREITRTRIRVLNAMAAQTLQGRYLGGRPPYWYRLADAGPHPNKADAAWARRARRLEPRPGNRARGDVDVRTTAGGHRVARIARALNETGIPCPSAADPDRNPHRPSTAWTLGAVNAILANPRGLVEIRRAGVPQLLVLAECAVGWHVDRCRGGPGSRRSSRRQPPATRPPGSVRTRWLAEASGDAYRR